MKQILSLQKLEKEKELNVSNRTPSLNYKSHLSWFGCFLRTHSHGCMK